jgi:PAS domain S-box-containing protein
MKAEPTSSPTRATLYDLDRVADNGPGLRNDRGPTPPGGNVACSMVDAVAAARTALEHGEGRHGPGRVAPAAIWQWDLASGRVEWDERLRALFGYAEMVTDAAWRENRIHPEDRDRVKISLQRATIVNHGALWSDQYRFLQADGSYADVTERAYVVNDDAGPRGVLGAITPKAAVNREVRRRKA